MGYKKSFISFLVMTMLVVSVPVTVSAVETVPVLKLDAVVKYPGDKIRITGTSTLGDVIVKIVRPDGTVLYFNALKVKQGTYEDSIMLPVDAMPGKYTVIVGQGGPQTTAKQMFSVAKKPDGGGSNSGGGGSSSSGNSGWSGGSSGTGVTSPTTEKDVLTIKEDGSGITAVIPSSALTVSEVTENGAALARVTVDKNMLTQTFQALKTQANEKGKALIAAIVVSEGDHLDGVKVELPAEIVKTAKSMVPNAVISIQSNGASIELPIKSIDVSRLEISLNAEASDMNIVVTTHKMPELFSEKERKMMAAEGIVTLTEPMSFHVTGAANNGKQVTLEMLGDGFINNTMSVTSKVKVDPKKSTVVAIDPITHKMRFVPSVLQSTGDGDMAVFIKHHANEIYMVVSSNPTFADVVGHWAQSSIEHLAAKQIVKGDNANHFDPNSSVTRAEFAALLVRAAGLKGSSQSSAFQDVQAEDWFAGTVQAAAELGLVKGMEDGTFQPHAQLTREQMAVMIERFMVLVDAETQSSSVDLKRGFKDSGSISDYAKSSMERLVANKLMLGVTADELAPKAKTTRAETVKILERCLRYAKLINDNE